MTMYGMIYLCKKNTSKILQILKDSNAQMQTSPNAPRPMILSVSKSVLWRRNCLMLDTTGLASNTTTQFTVHTIPTFT